MKTLFPLLLILLVFAACKKDKEPEPDPQSNLDAFVSLVAENDTIFTGQSTTITATATGTDVRFSWSASQGDIVGSGNQITYVAPTCTPGSNEISCTASASNRSETKKIIITVF
jgi:hypothetical protein